MAAMLMQPPAHRPSMDHVGSFESTRSGAPAGYDRHSPAPGQSRPSASAPNQSTQQPGVGFVQPAMASGYFPNNMPGFPVQGAWGATPLPASSFYAPPFAFPAGFQQQGFQQPQDFSAWAHVYQQMVANGHMAPPAGHNMPRPSQYQDAEDSDAHRRRTVSGTSSNDPRVTKGQPNVTPGGTDPVFHPYKRGPKSRSTSGNSRSGSQSISLSELPKPTAPQRGSSPGEHRRSGSVESSVLVNGEREEELMPPPKLRASRDEGRPASVKSERSNRSQGSAGSGASQGAHSAKQAQAAPERPQHGRTASSTSASNKSTPLTTGPISSHASNSQPPAQTRNSPLSQAPSTSAPTQTSEKAEKVEKKSGFRGRFKNATDKDQKTSAAPASRAQSPTPARSLTPAAAAKAPSGPTSTKQDLAPPNAPFVNAQAMSSDLSLAETERTAATNASVKPRRGLFRNRNRSSDNISLSSTVSSASMMIRKMGSLGKLARRNSLMGISKIFKDKPKDEDGPIPEKQGILSFKKKSGKKADLAPVSVSRTTAELDRGSEDDDRILAGLSPAAQLARQHTARSKAEAAKREASKRPEPIQELSGPSGEPTWDQNTTTARGQLTAVSNAQVNGSNVVHVVPRSPTVVHALAISGQEDGSDMSDTDTIDDVTASLNRSGIQDPDEEDFQPLWCKAHIDKHARPKRGILKQIQSNEEVEGSQRQRTASSSALEATAPGPLSDLPAPNPERIDGLAHAHANHVSSPGEMVYDPLSPTFSPFESSGLDLDLRPPVYKNPAHNTSAPTLSPAGPVAPTQARAMTAPARRRLVWAPECAVYSTYDAMTYDRRSEPATCNRLTPELAMSIKQELNAFKLEMPVHPSSRVYTHYFA